MTPAIRTEGLGKIYARRRTLGDLVLRPLRPASRVTALEGVTIEVRPGEIFGLLGPNGAGKTTLLKILACLVLPTGGRALVEGIDVSRDERAVKAAIGFATTDDRSFYWRLSARENLVFFARLYNLSLAQARRRAEDLLEAVELAERADDPFMDLSSGMKQRMAIARALLHGPRVLCLDEPTRSLDPIAAKHLRSFIARRLNGERGMTILLATHNLQEAEDLSARLAVLHRGRVLRQGSTAEVASGVPGRDHYLLTLSGLQEVPRDPRWSVTLEPASDGIVRVTAAVDRGGTALSDLLHGILERRGTIVACQRRESGLQGVFDGLEEAPPEGS
jgi:ABC-2 type transport system ATP-binding protein